MFLTITVSIQLQLQDLLIIQLTPVVTNSENDLIIKRIPRIQARQKSERGDSNYSWFCLGEDSPFKGQVRTSLSFVLSSPSSPPRSGRRLFNPRLFPLPFVMSWKSPRGHSLSFSFAEQFSQR